MTKHEDEAAQNNRIFFDKSYATIGRFMVQFESLCREMRGSVSTVLSLGGLRKSQMGYAVTADLTADPLRTLLLSVLQIAIEGRPDEEHFQRVISNVFTRIQKLTKTRNEVIHGSWYVELVRAEDNKPATPIGNKARNTKLGLTVKVLPAMNELESYTKEAKRLERLLALTTGALWGGDLDIHIIHFDSANQAYDLLMKELGLLD